MNIKYADLGVDGLTIQLVCQTEILQQQWYKERSLSASYAVGGATIGYTIMHLMMMQLQVQTMTQDTTVFHLQ